MRNSPTNRGVSNCLCGDVSKGDGFRPACEAVYTGEEVGESSRWQQGSLKVNVNGIKSGI